ncbi:MAG: phosphotransferase [Acidimicrobiales bacterium]
MGLLSELYRTTLSYEPAAEGAPTSLITKFAISDPAQRGMAEGLGFYSRELHFYTHLVDQMPIRTPRAVAAMQDPGSGDFILIMEDMSGLRSADQQVGVTWDDALRSARNQARLHAAFHQSDQLADLAATYPPIENPIYLAALPGVFAAGWENAQKHAGEHMTAGIKAFGDRYGDLLPFFLRTFMEPLTLLHGDWRADNLFYLSDDPADENQDMAIVDFQIMGQGTGAYDLAYFASQSIAPDVRSGRDK